MADSVCTEDVAVGGSCNFAFLVMFAPTDVGGYEMVVENGMAYENS